MTTYYILYKKAVFVNCQSKLIGAPGENRTRDNSLGSYSFTIKLRVRIIKGNKCCLTFQSGGY